MLHERHRDRWNISGIWLNQFKPQQMPLLLRWDISEGILMIWGAETKRGKGRWVARGQRLWPAVVSFGWVSSGGQEWSQSPAKGHSGWAANSQPLIAFTDNLTESIWDVYVDTLVKVDFVVWCISPGWLQSYDQYDMIRTFKASKMDGWGCCTIKLI